MRANTEPRAAVAEIRHFLFQARMVKCFPVFSDTPMRNLVWIVVVVRSSPHGWLA